MSTHFPKAIDVRHPVFEWVRAVLPAGSAEVFGGYVRDTLLGEPPADMDFMVRRESLPAIPLAAAVAGFPCTELSDLWYHGYRICMYGTQADFLPCFKNFDFTVNSLRADVHSGEVRYTSPEVLQHLADKQAVCLNAAVVRAHRFAKMAAMGFLLAPEQDLLDQLKDDPEEPFDPYAPPIPTRLPALRKLMRENGWRVVGAGTASLVGSGSCLASWEGCMSLHYLEPGTQVQELPLELASPSPSPCSSIEVEDTDEEGFSVFVSLVRYDPATFYSPVTIGYVPVSHDGDVDVTRPEAADLFARRLVFIPRPPCGGQRAHDYMFEVDSWDGPVIAMPPVSYMALVGFHL